MKLILLFELIIISFHPDRNSIFNNHLIPPGRESLITTGRNPSFHPDGIPHSTRTGMPHSTRTGIPHSTRTGIPHSTRTGIPHYTWTESLIPPGYLISSACPTDVPPLRISHIRHPCWYHHIRHPCRRAGEEDDLTSRANMSGSFGNAYLECALDLSAIPTLSS